MTGAAASDDTLRAVAAYGLLGTTLGLPREPLAVDSWARVREQVQAQQLSGLLWLAVRDGAFATTDEQRGEAAAVHISAMSVVLRLEALLLTVVRELRDGGVAPRVLKGTAVAHLDYPDPCLRPFGDIDLLVRPEHFDGAVRRLVALGYRRQFAEPRPGFDHRFGKGASFEGPGGLEVDLHRTFVLGAFGLRIDLDELWRGAEPFVVGGQELTALGAEERFLHACYSVAIADAVPRLLVQRDVAQMLLHSQVDVGQVRERAANWGAEAVLARAVSLTWQSLGLADVTALSSWALRFRPDARVARNLALYTTPGVSYTAQSLATVAAIRGVRSKARFALALGLPRRDYRAAVHRGFAARLRKGVGDLAQARRQP